MNSSIFETSINLFKIFIFKTNKTTDRNKIKQKSFVYVKLKTKFKRIFLIF